MATSHIFNSRVHKLPGVYAMTKSLIQAPAVVASYSKVLIIDTGMRKEVFGRGAGVVSDPNFEGTGGKNSIYHFRSATEMRSFVKAGYWHTLADALFNPSQVPGTNGVSDVYFISALQTTAATAKIPIRNKAVADAAINAANAANVDSATPAAIASAIPGANEPLSGKPEDIIKVAAMTAAAASGATRASVVSAVTNTANGVRIEFVIRNRYEGRFGNSWGHCVGGSTGNVFQPGFTPPSNTPLQEASNTTTHMETLKSGCGFKVIRSGGNFEIQFCFGNYRGIYSSLHEGDDERYSGLALEDADEKGPDRIPSGNLVTIIDLYRWLMNNPDFNDSFSLASRYDETILGGNLVDSDIVSLDGKICPFSGGTESPQTTPELIDLVIEATKGIDSSFVITDRNGIMAGSDEINFSILPSVINQRFEQWMVVGGGKDKTEFDQRLTQGSSSISMCKEYDSDRAWVVHGGIVKSSDVTNKQRNWDSLYHACYILGRCAGMPPQVPLTFKEVNIRGLVHELTDDEKEKALDAGLLITYFDDDFQRFCVLKGINTLQNNDQMVNPDGTSHLIQLRRCAAQINKEMIQDAKRELFSQREGVTVMSLPAKQVETWVAAKLVNKIDRQLLVEFANVNVTREKDAYFVTYGFIPNYEINFMFFTSFILE
jgi:hypothetical protein